MTLVGSANAQPVLNRVEDQIRDQVGAAQTSQGEAPAQTGESGYLGLSADERQGNGGGVRVAEISPGSPAAQGGLLAGDVIVAIDGNQVRGLDEMSQRMANKPVGTTIRVTVNRAGVEREHVVTLGRQPQSRLVQSQRAEPTAQPPADAGAGSTTTTLTPPPRLGIRTLPVTEQVRTANNLPDGRGATVIAVTVDSPAHRAGIPLGAVITAVDNQPVDNPQTLAAAIKQAGAEVELSYVERGQLATRRVALAGTPPAAGEPGLELRGKPQEGPDAQQATEPPQLGGPNDPAERVEALEARIRELEARIEKLEAALANQPKE
jgi:S1-C subfamily serine protease